MPNVTGGNRDTFGGSARAGGNTSGGRGTAGGSGPNATAGNQYAGYKGPVGTRAPTAAAPGSYGLSGAETRQYNSAKSEYMNRGIGKRIVDFFSPVKSVNPQINQPASYAAGQYHHGFNPVGLAVGMAAPYGTGTVLGPAAGAAFTAMGGHDVVLTGPGSGFSTSYPDGGPGYNSQTGYAGPHQPGADPMGHADQSGSPMGAFPSTPAPFGAQPAAPAVPGAQPSGMPAFPVQPKVPNHTLPQGYQSLFPTSLSDADKALLYGKALMA